MSRTTTTHETAAPPGPATSAPDRRPSPPGKALAHLKLVLTRTIFWSYKRGTWQYDLIVIAILAFIFFSPRSWFSDRPTLQLTDLRHIQGIVEIGRIDKKDFRYLMDARLVDSLGQKPEDAIPLLLKHYIQRPFTVISIDTVRDRHDVILGYTVMVEE
jgi:hypothetical protein